jgi:type IV pilus assembly protein PilM
MAPAGGRPPAAVEISPQGVLAAAVKAGSGAVYAFAALPVGALTPRLDGINVHAPDAVASAIRTALDEVSPRTRAVTLVLPDTLVRVFVLEFDSLPAKAAEAIPVLRFRLRKMVPFDAEHAAVSYQVLSQSQTECNVLTAVIPGPVLAEYESAVRAAGYEAGAVLPSSLAALETMDEMEAVLAAHLSGSTMTTTITNGQDLLLYRTVDLPQDRAERTSDVQRGIAVAAAYYEDKLQAPPRHLYYAGNEKIEEFAAWVGDVEMTIVELAPRPESGAVSTLGLVSFAGVNGALAGAR